jgi:hypothetical protein
LREIPQSLRPYMATFRAYLSVVNPVKLKLIACLSEGKSNLEIAKKDTADDVKVYSKQVEDGSFLIE